jgi:hypothetical protein
MLIKSIQTHLNFSNNYKMLLFLSDRPTLADVYRPMRLDHPYFPLLHAMCARPIAASTVSMHLPVSDPLPCRARVNWAPFLSSMWMQRWTPLPPFISQSQSPRPFQAPQSPSVPRFSASRFSLSSHPGDTLHPRPALHLIQLREPPPCRISGPSTAVHLIQ